MARERIKAVAVLLVLCLCVTGWADFLADLARPHEGRSMRATSTAKLGSNPREWQGEPDPNSNSDNSSVPPGQTKVLMDVKGPGVITHIWMTFLGPEPHPWAKNGSANHQEMLLRIYWDGDERPGVEAPVGDFFANSFGKRSEVISLPVIVEDADSYNCFWHMPFRKSARVEVVNQSEKPISLLYFNIDWIKKDKIARDTPYFYAQYRQEYPVEKGKDYVILETQGKGHYVGTVLSVRTRPILVWRRRREDLHRRRSQTLDLGHRDRRLLPLRLGSPDDEHAVLRSALLRREWGIVGGHTSAYLAHCGPAGLQ